MLKTCLLDIQDGVIITLRGRDVCTEEAASVWQEMDTATRSRYLGMTDVHIIESIYSDPAIGFNYL